MKKEGREGKQDNKLQEIKYINQGRQQYADDWQIQGMYSTTISAPEDSKI